MSTSKKCTKRPAVVEEAKPTTMGLIASEPIPTFVDNVLRDRCTQLLAKLAIGKWSDEDSVELRTCYEAMRHYGLGGASRDGIYSAISRGGLNFKEEKLVLDHASVLQALTLPDGRTVIIAVCFDADALIARRGAAGRLDLAYSGDGLNFKRDLDFRIVGLYTQDTIDPDIVLLPDGTLRLYYLAREGTGN